MHSAITAMTVALAARGANPWVLTMLGLREALRAAVVDGAAPNKAGRYETAMQPDQMVQLRADPEYLAAVAAGEVVVMHRPLRALQRKGGAYLELVHQQ